MTYEQLRRLLFRVDAETSHELGLAVLRLVPRVGPWARRWRRRHRLEDERLECRLLGHSLANPVGLAAGFDKDGRVLRAVPLLGFGFAELGTVTPRPQVGNPRPRLFRHQEAGSLENAMGFNNRGGRALAERVRALAVRPVPLGINLGKNRTTPAEGAADDYCELLTVLDGLADYFVVNLSSPNTPGLRDLQNELFLSRLLKRARELTATPILVKISPDLDDDVAVDLSSRAVDEGASGVIVANTTTDYSLLPQALGRGGLSGAVLTDRSRGLLAALGARLADRTTLISVGGIASGREVYRRLRLGASAVQLYTALVYEGPRLVRGILAELLEAMERDGVKSVSEVIGVESRRDRSRSGG